MQRQLIGASGWSPIVFSVPNVANGAGSGDGDAVTVSSLADFFTDAFGTGLLPSIYSVQVAPNQACWPSVTNKTISGFDVVLTPASGVTLAAGTFDVLVFGT
jgi:hypothetical protein